MTAQGRVGRVVVSTAPSPHARIGQVSVTQPLSTGNPQGRLGKVVVTVTPSTPLTGVKIRAGGVWKTAQAVNVRKGGAWHPGTPQIRKSGVWKPAAAPTGPPVYTPPGVADWSAGLQPSLANVGWQPFGVTPKPYDGSLGAQNAVTGELVLSTPGVRLAGWDINGWVTVKAANITVERNRIHPSYNPGYAQSKGIVDCSKLGPNDNAVVQDNELFQEVPNPWFVGVFGRGYRSQRNLIYWVTDGHGAFNQTHGATEPVGVTIQGNVCMAASLFLTGTANSDGATHNDMLVQIEGGTGGVVRYNTVYGLFAGGTATDGTVMPKWPGWGDMNNPDKWTLPPLSAPSVARSAPGNVSAPWQYATASCVQVTLNQGPSSGWLIQGNWLYGGANGISLANGPYGASYNIGTIQSNKFDRGQGLPSSHSATSNTTYCFGVAAGATYTDGGSNIYLDGVAASVRKS